MRAAHKGFGVERTSLKQFHRQFFDSSEKFTYIGDGELGGKAQGLAFMSQLLELRGSEAEVPGVSVSIPTMTVITTEHFDTFMKMNNLADVIADSHRDDQIAGAFQKASLPAELVGDLRALIAKVTRPLAVRSSSLLEDALYEPFAGVYGTKMIPNNQLDVDTRFQKLLEAVKYVYASTYFQAARDYIRATGNPVATEKMAVIIQEVVGQRFGDRFYPTVSGVGRSFNYYPTGHARPEEGVVTLALGLGKTIVDGGKAFQYSPAHPQSNPIYNSIDDLLEQTQSSFWSVNMGKPPEHDPIKETEYLVRAELSDAEKDGTLRFVASTYRPQEDRIQVGISNPGPRLLNFAPIVSFDQIPLNVCINKLLKLCEDALGAAVEIEFAVTLDPDRGLPARFGFLQVRPMVVSNATVDVAVEELSGPDVLAASENVMGNGEINTLSDVVFLKPDAFTAAKTPAMTGELECINRLLLDEGRPYLLIGFGRWGSSDSWLGIPVDWGQIAGAKVIVEATLPKMAVDLSQGSHFFHNISSFQVLYFSVDFTKQYPIDFEWLNQQQIITDMTYARHVRLAKPLRVRVDGRTKRGIIAK